MTHPQPAQPAQPAQPVRRHTQARGRARREALLQAARLVLENEDCATVTLPQIAERAGIPASSAYHFYPEIGGLYKDLVREIALEMVARFRFRPGAESWRDTVTRFLDLSRDYFNGHAAARQLMLGPRIAPEVKKAACWEDYRFGRALMAGVEQDFVLPPLDDPAAVFFKALQIADFFYSLSVMEHGRISAEARAEGAAATLAYLALYLPHFLPRRGDTAES